jgi:hypothetical protein
MSRQGAVVARATRESHPAVDSLASHKSTQHVENSTPLKLPMKNPGCSCTGVTQAADTSLCGAHQQLCSQSSREHRPHAPMLAMRSMASLPMIMSSSKSALKIRDDSWKTLLMLPSPEGSAALMAREHVVRCTVEGMGDELHSLTVLDALPRCPRREQHPTASPLSSCCTASPVWRAPSCYGAQ